jgi:FixJ family two-component response regulator/chemotaxis methyl-accepting protein methylase
VGNLDACRQLVQESSLQGLTFILVEPLDSIGVRITPQLLGVHPAINVMEVTDQAPLQRGHFYIAPPGCTLSVEEGKLLVLKPLIRNSARFAFDLLLRSLAAEFGARTACLILSGNGSHGTIGLRAIKESGGLVVAQDPTQAAASEMSRTAIETGFVDLVLPTQDIPKMLLRYFDATSGGPARDFATSYSAPKWLDPVLDTLQRRTGCSYQIYQDAEVQRAAERRMALLGIEEASADRYLDLLKNGHGEIDALLKRLASGGATFFLNLPLFDHLSSNVIPDLQRTKSTHEPIRVWVPACGTGEEAYSVAIAFLEQLQTRRSRLPLKVFASDDDERAISFAREGVYPESIEADLSLNRLSCFFVRERYSYRALSRLRSTVAFVKHDFWQDPPFLDIDLVICQNLLPRTSSRAKADAISRFEFAIRPGGILMLGRSDPQIDASGCFKPMADCEGMYLRVGATRAMQFLSEMPDRPRSSVTSDGGAHPSMSAALPPFALDEESRRAVGSDSGATADQSSAGGAAAPDISTDTSASGDAELERAKQGIALAQQELQSLTCELRVLQSQLHDLRDRSDTVHNDLRNVLHSTELAMLIVDGQLNLKFFTPSITQLFRVVSSDIGRPISDLVPLTTDSFFLSDAVAVLRGTVPMVRNVEAPLGRHYTRRMSLYRTDEGFIGSVVVTYSDVTELRDGVQALEKVRWEAEDAALANSDFLSATSRDLREPLQTLSLLRDLMSREMASEGGKGLLAIFDNALGAISGMLDGMQEAAAIEGGKIHADTTNFPVANLLSALSSEFSYHAQAKGLTFIVVPCGLSIRSDPHLLMLLIRRLLMSTVKHTVGGRILLGCRRRRSSLRIDIISTGMRISEAELSEAFRDETTKDSSRAKSSSVERDFSIVQPLSRLLRHSVLVRSQRAGNASLSVEVPLSAVQLSGDRDSRDFDAQEVARGNTRGRRILLVESDPEARRLLELVLGEEGYETKAVGDGIAALDAVARSSIWPDLILTSYRLPKGVNGLQLSTKLRDESGRRIPVILLSGGKQMEVLQMIAFPNSVHLRKPVATRELIRSVRHLLSQPVELGTQSEQDRPSGDQQRPIYVVDGNGDVRDAIRRVLEDDGRAVEAFASCEDFLASFKPGHGACLLVDARFPGMSGLELLQHLRAAGHHIPAIMMANYSDMATAVQAMKTGAADFVEKPIGRAELLASVDRVFDRLRDPAENASWGQTESEDISGLTPRQVEVMRMVLSGKPSKNIAADLRISRRTVEKHRAEIMRRTGARSLPELARIAFAAGWDDVIGPSAES